MQKLELKFLSKHKLSMRQKQIKETEDLSNKILNIKESNSGAVEHKHKLLCKINFDASEEQRMEV